ncbi:ATP-binding protein [Streptomyces sp. XY413]|uniref:ATP-binding protein n=1 Tax=Streptomyces sp. XY413 TaxID=1519479 RepID=UPI00099C2CD5|nr:ATP-binding protein [Streptomyces sp. XY413]
MSIAPPPLEADALGRAGFHASAQGHRQADASFERSGLHGRDAPRTGQARRITADLLRLWGLAELVDPACLAVSELVTNAFVHGEGETVTIRMSVSDTHLRIEVRDGGSWTPRPLSPDPLAQGGRGMLLVEAVADAWGIADSGAVWCVFHHETSGGSR